MPRTPIFQLVLGFLLSGCTITNTIPINLTVTDAGVHKLSTALKDEDENPDVVVASESPPQQHEAQESRPQSTKQPKHSAKAPVVKKPANGYCDYYSPPVPPTPVPLDEVKYMEIVRKGDPLAITAFMSQSMEVLKEQMRDYKVLARDHHNAWKKQCKKQ